MKKIIILTSVIIVIAVSGFLYAKGTPQYSLYQLRKTIANHDANNTMRFFDVDSIVDNQMNDFMKQYERKPTNEFEQMGNNLVKERMAMMIPTMKETLKGQLKTSIITSSDDETPVNIIRKGSLSDFNITTQGEKAILSSKNSKEINFKMVKTPEGYWKIIQLMKPDSIESVH